MLAAVTATSGDLLFTGELVGDFPVLDGRGKQYVAATSWKRDVLPGDAAKPGSREPPSGRILGMVVIADISRE